MNMYYCRKVFATYLRNKGIVSKLIDLPWENRWFYVCVNHYYIPDFNEIITNKINTVELLHKDLVDRSYLVIIAILY